MFINKPLLALVKGTESFLFLRICSEIFLYGLILCRTLLISTCINLFLRGVSPLETKIFFFLFITILGELFFVFVNPILSARTGAKIKEKIREDLLESALVLGPSYTSKQRSGDMISSLTSKIEAMEPYFTAYLPNGIATIFWGVLVIFYLTTINLWVAMTCLLGMSIVIFAPNYWRKIMLKIGDEDWTLMTTFKSEMMDNLQGMSTLKAFNANDTRGTLIRNLAWELHKKTMKHLSITQIESGVLIFGAYFGSTLSVAVAIGQSISGNIGSEALITILFLISACFAPAFSLIDTWHLGYHGMVASPSVFALLEEGRTERNRKNSLQSNLVEAGKQPDSIEITLENLHFSYVTGEPVLKGISLTIPNGKKVALVGRSGSGKSTIINLLAGFYPLEQGSISVNGSIMDIVTFRESMGIVWQESYLFYGTMRENVTLGMKNVSEKAMIEACKSANIHDFICQLPHGYDTAVSEGGNNLSGGEKQRIAIARCFLRNPKFLIFDEATSHLDIENEEIVKKSMESLMKNRTVLIIAHRLNTIENADKVYVIEEGKIIKNGTPKEFFSLEWEGKTGGNL